MANPRYPGPYVSVIDGVSNTVVATVAVKDYPRNIAVNPITDRIYVPNSGDDTVSVIEDDAPPAPTSTITLTPTATFTPTPTSTYTPTPTATVTPTPTSTPTPRVGPCSNDSGTCLELDMDPTNGAGPCNPVDGTATVSVGSNHDVAICLTNSQIYGVDAEPNAFNFDLVYDDALNHCVPNTDCTANPESTDPRCLDSNPDANAKSLGGTTFSTPSLGSGWDCSFGVARGPVCDSNPDPAHPGPRLGRATLVCISTTPGILPVGSGVSAPLAEVHMKALGAGADNLSLEWVSVSHLDGWPIVRCNGYTDLGLCIGGTAIKVLPSPTATSTPIPPTPTPPHPPAVGGKVILPPAAIAAESGASAVPGIPVLGINVPGLLAQLIVFAILLTAVAVGGSYARRRWLR